MNLKITYTISCKISNFLSMFKFKCLLNTMWICNIIKCSLTPLFKLIYAFRLRRFAYSFDRPPEEKTTTEEVEKNAIIRAMT